jgi:hypothetical protein
LGTTCHASASDTRHEPPHAVDVADLRKRRGVTGSAAGRGNGAAHKISPTHHKDATTVCVPVYETALASRCRWPSTSGAVRDARRPPLTRRYLPQPQRHSPAASGDQFANPCPRPGQHVPDSTSMAQVAVAAGVVDRDGANGPSVVTGAGQLPGVRGGCVSVSGNVSFQ